MEAITSALRQSTGRSWADARSGLTAQASTICEAMKATAQAIAAKPPMKGSNARAPTRAIPQRKARFLRRMARPARRASSVLLIGSPITRPVRNAFSALIQTRMTGRA